MNTIFTVGHSNHDIVTFLSLLKRHQIEVIGDVRSSPYSQYSSQFNRETLKKNLKENGIRYVFLGDQLGARPKSQAYYTNGHADFSLMAKSSVFQEGLGRVQKGAEQYRLSLMCSEKDPISCHRTILVCRNLRSADIQIKHIHADGALETQQDLELRLLKHLKMPTDDFFQSQAQLIEAAYDKQGEKIAYQEQQQEEEFMVAH